MKSENFKKAALKSALKSANRYAKFRGLANVSVKFDEKNKEYVMYIGKREEYRSKSLESMGAHIDILMVVARFNP